MLWLTNSTVRPSRATSLHFPQALLLKRGITHGQHLIDDQNLRLQVCSDSESQPDVHPARVVFDWRIDELLHPEKSTISSDFRSISRFVIPRIAPLRYMFRGR